MEFWGGKDPKYILYSQELYEESIDIKPSEEPEIYLVRIPFLRDLPQVLLVRTKSETGKYVCRRANYKSLFKYLLVVSVKAPLNFPVSTFWDLGLHVAKSAILVGPNNGRVLVELHANPDCLDHPIIAIYTLEAFKAFYQPNPSTVVGPSKDSFTFPEWFDELPEFLREDLLPKIKTSEPLAIKKK